MWQQNVRQEDSVALHPKKARRRAAYQAGEEAAALLTVQVILCVVIGVLAMLVKILNLPILQDVQEQYDAMITHGVRFSVNTPLVRFAGDSMQRAKEMVHDLLNAAPTEPKPAGGQGGYCKAEDSQMTRQPETVAKASVLALQLPVNGVLTSAFGPRTNPISKEPDFHQGIDLASAEGTPITCAADGVVMESGYSRIRGNYFVLRHENGVKTIYQHLAYVLVREGARVRRGEVLGTVGQTGMATGPHLHWELWVDGQCIDPYAVLEPFVKKSWV